jgi:D-alanyl-D-alanine carboxypeptidase (penicillin-binding protein 5/6)
MLLGLLLPSANNFADTLGRWVSGSVPAFVDQLNASAQRLGMAHTHFADPSGFEVATVASASDLVLLGKAVLDNAPLSALVATQQARLPDGTDLTNLDSLLGTVPGWLGIKTGSTPQAGGCLLFAARRDIGASAPVTIVGAVLGQTDLHAALDAARTAVETGYEGYGVIHTSDIPTVDGDVTTAWGTLAGVHVRPAGNAAIAARTGTLVQLASNVHAVSPGAAADSGVASIDGSVEGHAAALHWTVVLDRDVPRPSAWWMLLHG